MSIIENENVPAVTENTAAPESDGAEDQVEQEGSEVEEVVADAEAVVADPNASKAEKAVAKKMLKSLKIKVDGKEYNEELPFEIEDTPKQVEWMQKQLQLARVSQKRMQEKSETESEIAEFLEQLRNNPEEVLTNPHIGVDLKKFAARIIEQEIENEKKSPSELKAEKLEKELKAIKEAQEKEKETNKARELERIQEEALVRYEQQMDSAFEKNKDIPKSAYFIKRISDYMLMALQNGMDVSPEDVMPIVREERRAELKEMFGSSNDDLLEELLGKERLSGMRKKAVTKAKAAQVAPKIADTGGKPQKAEVEVKKQTIRDFFKV